MVRSKRERRGDVLIPTWEKAGEALFFLFYHH